MKISILKNGFNAIAKYTKEFDRFNLTPDNFRVNREIIDEMASKIDKKLATSLRLAVERVKAFHQNQTENVFNFIDDFDNRMGQKIVPLESTAVYVPGGNALYPSTFYMTIIPAIIAGVERIIVLTPPRTITESPEVAFLIKELGIKEVYIGSGPALVLAAAYGINELKNVDKIVGPGNAYVAKAKQIAYGKIDIDMIAGPSDITVLADSKNESDIPWIASDLLSQAEHDTNARSVLVGTDKVFLDKIKAEVYKQADSLPNKERILESLNSKGMIIECPDKFTAVDLINKIAPEHLELFSDTPEKLLDKVKFAGSVFLGKYTPESVGDYLGGPNHVLPTSGTARFFSPLGVYDFVKRVSWIEFSKKSLKKFYPHICAIARSEKLEAHARSAEIRFEK